ncbi:uncharacterized protein [Channa argus]|uniref:uncharacterized protein n=1 Tax=Channa argus TaxID=215402 RepID=UPI0035217692
MDQLELILLSVLLFEAADSVGRFSHYYRPGHEAALPCFTESSSETSSCSNIHWLYNRDQTSTQDTVVNGNVEKSLDRSVRLSLSKNCSLLISNITAEDAGSYTCRRGRDTQTDVITDLNVLIISASPPDADPNRDGEVTLTCSLERYRGLGPCQENSIRWVNETGAVLLGEGVGYKFIRQMNCSSVLTVRHQSGHSRTYTCQFVDETNSVTIEAEYTLAPNDNKTLIIIGSVVGVVVVVVLIVITAAFVKYRTTTNMKEDVDVHPPDQREANLTYVTISHDNQKASPDTKAKDDKIVTYSSIRNPVKVEADHDPNYSCVI